MAVTVGKRRRISTKPSERPDRAAERPALGLGFRFQIQEPIIDNLDRFDFLEVIVDNYLAATGRQRRLIEDLAARLPLVCHGVGLSLGTDIAPDPRYLESVAEAISRLAMPFYGEHLAFTGVPGIQLGELLPLPRTEAVAERVIDNVNAVRAAIPVPFCLENIAYYFDYPDAELSEPEFLNLVSAETGSHILLDVENLHVNSVNFGSDPHAFIDALQPGSVLALHLAGGQEADGILIDDHGHAVPDQVLDLLAYVLERHRPEFIILERDINLHPFADILDDIERIRNAITPPAQIPGKSPDEKAGFIPS